MATATTVTPEARGGMGKSLTDPCFPAWRKGTGVVPQGDKQVEVEILVQRFADRWLIVATQAGRIGTWLEASIEKGGQHDRVSDDPCYEVNVLLGQRDDLWQQVLVRQILTLTSAADGVPVGPDTKPALLGLGIKVSEEQTVRALVEVCRQVISEM